MNLNSKFSDKETPIVIYQTDLYHPHEDPDDHYDLAVLFSLAVQGFIELADIIIDFPPSHCKGDPAINAVEQIKYISGMDASMHIGTLVPMRSREDTQLDIPKSRLGAVERIAAVLRQSPRKVYIIIVGGCSEVAIAGKRYPELFKNKCAGVLLNAGSGLNQEGCPLEYNVKLNPIAYSAVFDLNCPVYWFPCFHLIEKTGNAIPGEYATFYQFRQSDIFKCLSDNMKNYFLYMLDKSTDPKYIRYIDGSPSEDMIKKYGALYRNMWSTASLLYAAGKAVREDGSLVDYKFNDQNALYTMEAVRVTCSAEGITSWEYDNSSTDRFIFHIKQLENYKAAMTRALSNILVKLT